MTAEDFTAAKELQQQNIARETLARLQAEQDKNPSAGLEAQISFWQRQIPAAPKTEALASRSSRKPAVPKPDEVS